ncbi:cytochrome P450 [Pseudonocardia hispaniensis]|uniref:Cytochrome P450 n=1 Tax=Pseudonocardia hispaniensis TaxID=904933 RepID=A0ABW1J789_9PSEU
MTETPTIPVHLRRIGFDPIDELGRLRENEGVTRVVTSFGIPAYLVTRYEDVREVLSDPVRFSNAHARHPLPNGAQPSEEEITQRRAGQLLAFDPPEHTRLRRMLTPEFTVRRIRRLVPRISAIVDSHLDDLQRAGAPADLVSGFALPIPSLVICELLGVPYADRAEFQQRTRRQLDISVPIKERMALHRESREFMRVQVARAQAAPGEDMLGMLVREHGEELTTDELIGIAGLLLVAGHETTANMLGLGTLALLRHPEQLAMVRDDPDLVEPAVEELLRWLSIVPSGIPRTTTTSVTLAGHVIPAGELVVCSLPAANRDPALVAAPERLDIARGTPGHVAFGHGVHHCLGAPLARMEMTIAFPALLRRFPGLSLAVPFEEIGFRAHHVVFGVHSLPVTW